jgi:hypothetical protein
MGRLSGWDAAVFGGLLGFVLLDAAVLTTVLIAGLVYVGWANVSTMWAYRRRAPRREATPTQEYAEQTRN